MNTTRHSSPRTRSTESTTEDVAADTCPECDGDLVADDEHAETVCSDCGLVVDEDEIDRGPEWRAFDARERDEKSRVGSPITETMPDKGLTTTISWQDRDANGHTLSPDKRTRMKRLRTWQRRIRTNQTGERNLSLALSEIDRMASALGAPQAAREFASVVYRRALSEDLIRGRSIEAVASAALYLACRQEGIPRSLDEVTEVSRVGKVEIGRAYRYVSAELGIHIGPTDPTEYVPRFCSDLDVSEAVSARAVDIIETAAEEGVASGKSPSGFAAAAIYAASRLCDEKRTQSEVADVARVTEVTVRNRYQEQMQTMDASRLD